MANRVAGIAFLKINAQQYPLRGNFTVSPSPIERNGIAGQDYVHGYQELPRVPYIEGDVTLVPELSTEAIEAIDGNATVTAELANGHIYVLREAWCAAKLEINTHDGSTKVRFEGTSCEELTP